MSFSIPSLPLIKNSKRYFLKFVFWPEATSYFFDETGRSRFPLYWTKKPRDFKEWPRPGGGIEELEILSLFDMLPRKLPMRKLVGVHAKSLRWAAIKGMLVSFTLGRYF